MISIIEIANPFEPFKDSVRQIRPAGITVAQYLHGREFQHPTICILNGCPLLRREWPVRVLEDGDTVNFIAQPGAAYAGIIALVVAAASVAVSAYFYLTMPDPSTPGQTPEADPVYSLTGQKNQNRLLQPIEVGYGRTRMWPSYGAVPYNQYIDNDQYLYQLFCVGQGEYDVEGVFIEDTPVENFQAVSYEITGPGGSVTLFPDNVVTSPEVGALELFGPNEEEYVDPGWYGPFTANDAGSVTDRLEIDVVFPGGCYLAEGDGGLSPVTVTAEFEYRRVDDAGVPVGGWILLFSYTNETEVEKVSMGIPYTEVVGMATTTPQRITLSQTVASGRYEVRGRRTSDKVEDFGAQNKLVWAALRAFLPNTKDYGDVTMLAVKARATNDLNSNASNRINLVATRKLPIWDGAAWSAPAATRSIVWAFADVLRSTYGGNMADTYLDTDTLLSLDAIYADRGEHFDWVFDQKTTVWEALTTICRCGRAVPMMSGSLMTIIREAAASAPVAVFGPQNMVRGSFQWDVKLYEMEEYDSVSVEYLDPSTWKQETVLCALPDSAGLYPETLRLPGCADRDHAYHEGMFITSMKRYVRESITFRTGLEGHIPTYGDLVGISHDLPRWGVSGYVMGIDGVDVQVSEPLEFTAGQTHYMAIKTASGGVSGPYICTAGADAYHAVLAEAPAGTFYFDDAHERSIYLFGISDSWAKFCKVAGISPAGGEEIEVQCVNYAPVVFDYDNDSAPPLTSGTTPLGPNPLPLVLDLTVTAFSWTLTQVQLSWTPDAAAIFYIVQISYDNVNWSNIANVSTASYVLSVTPGYLYIRVAGVNVGMGAFALWEGNVGVPTSGPLNPTVLTLQSPFTGTFAKMQWVAVLNSTSYRIEVYRDGGATLSRTTDIPLGTLTYTYSIEMALADGTPDRELVFKLYGVNDIGVSATPATCNATNPAPAVLTGLSSSIYAQDSNTITYTISWTACADTDFSTYKAWASMTIGFTPNDALNLVYQGIANSGQIQMNKSTRSAAITGITQASQAVMTAAGHGISAGDQVTLSGVAGMTEVNGNTYDVVSVTTDTLTLDVDSSGFTAYTSGGTVTSVGKYAPQYYWRVAALDVWGSDYNVSGEAAL